MYDGETMVRHGVAQSSAFHLGLLSALIYGGTMWGTSSPMAQEKDTGIAPASVQLEAPSEVPPRSIFPVAWTGPAGPKDLIVIVAAGADLRATSLSYPRYASSGNRSR